MPHKAHSRRWLPAADTVIGWLLWLAFAGTLAFFHVLGSVIASKPMTPGK